MVKIYDFWYYENLRIYVYTGNILLGKAIYCLIDNQLFVTHIDSVESVNRFENITILKYDLSSIVLQVFKISNIIKGHNYKLTIWMNFLIAKICWTPYFWV